MNKENRKYLSPGEIFISEEETSIWTLLGSCISIIMYDPKSHFTAISHAQLPNPSTHLHCYDTCPDPCYRDINESNHNKYVTCSTRFMLNKFKEKNISNEDIIVYLIGGANVININMEEQNRVGQKNINAAKTILNNLKIKITEESTGGKKPKTILFSTVDGELKIK